MISQIIPYIRQKNAPLKNALIIAFLIFSTIASATDYYISSSGNDANNGLSSSTPWKTIAKVNSSFSTLKPGDRILFNRGDVFYGSLKISKSGLAGSPITISAYGAGAKPIITGFTMVSAWTNLGSNIWESTSAVSTLSTCNMVTINGVNTGMGRYPNTGYLTYQTYSGNKSITSSSLSGTPNWTGAEVVIKKHRWIIDRNHIIAQTGGTLTYTPSSTYYGQNNWGFFIQNDARTLDKANEWYYNPSTKKIRVYSTSSAINVQVASLDTLVFMTYKNYITFDNISFRGANGEAFYIGSSSNITIQNSSIDFCYDGIFGADLGSSSANFKLQNSTINHSNNDAVKITKEFTNATISNNIIKNTGMIAGMGGSGDNKYTGMMLENISNSLIQYNEIDSSGYCGISFPGGNFTKVTNNLVNYFCMINDDGGGIYTYAPATGKIIAYNNVLNGIGNGEGVNNPGSSAAFGVYIDAIGNTSGVQILNNSIANIGRAGIFLHNVHDIITRNNTVYNSIIGLLIKNDDDTYITNLIVKNNIFFAKTFTQLAFEAITLHNDISSFGTIDSNYYARPIDDRLVFNVQPTGQSQTPGFYFMYTLEGWQTYSGFDAHSHKSPIALADTADNDFYYNATKTNKIITLYQSMIDVKGIKYMNSITLLPFSSVVLMVDPNPTNQPPVVEIFNPSKGNKYENPATITIDAIASDPDGSISKVEFYSGAVKLVELTSAPYSYTWKDVEAGSYSITAIATDNLNATATSLPIEFEVAANIKYDANSEIINLYPNPNDGHFSIKFINPLQNEKSEVVITDLAGKQVYNGLVSKEEIIKQIDLSYIKSGIYILMIIYKEILVTKKIIKY